jgi:hypothetical protein
MALKMLGFAFNDWVKGVVWIIYKLGFIRYTFPC